MKGVSEKYAKKTVERDALVAVGRGVEVAGSEVDVTTTLMGPEEVVKRGMSVVVAVAEAEAEVEVTTTLMGSEEVVKTGMSVAVAETAAEVEVGVTTTTGTERASPFTTALSARLVGEERHVRG